MSKSLALHLGVLAILLVLAFIMPAYHHGNMARIMVLAVYAMGFNILFGYTGLLSLGHALLFAAGLYGMGLSAQHLGLPAAPAFLIGIAAATAVGTVLGFLALRTIGVAFMIVTLMFAQAGFLTILYFGEWTRGDEGFVLQQASRGIAGLDLSNPDIRYLFALGLLAVAMLIKLRLIQSPMGRVLIAIRENEDRATMLGYDTHRHKLIAVILSAGFSGAAGAAYGILFGYVGASFAAVPYSILPLLWVLVGGAGTVLGPLLGTIAMFYLVDFASGITDAYLALVGVALVFLILFARAGLLGFVRDRYLRWLP